MTASLSFRSQVGARPSRYRTPSPPRHAVEPLSPHTSPGHRRTSSPRSTASDKATSVRKNAPGPPNLNGSRGRSNHAHTPNTHSASKAGGHSRSGSTIDTLATIALATSPTFSPHPHNSMGSSVAPDSMPHMSPGRHESMERPAKRARSEKAPSPTWQKSGGRPATSHISTLDSMKTDAELLLNFARPNNLPWSAHERHKENEHDELHSTESKSSANPENLHSGYQATTDNRMPSALQSGTIGPARMRSRSDGSAMVARPAMNSLKDSSYNQHPYFGAVVEDHANVVGQPPGTVAFENETDTSQSKKQEPVSDPAKRNSPHSLSQEPGLDTDPSGQAQCASCDLVRMPADGGDDADVTWVNCDGCNRWFHIVCAGFKNDREIRTVDKFICRECRPSLGPTTFLRKSSRARTAIDYAGLNQGFVKSSAETLEHHYIRPLKEGKISFLPDNFARLPPELVTAQYFQHGVGMKEPIVIPSHLNTSAPAAKFGALGDSLHLNEAGSQEEFDEVIDNLTAQDDGFEDVADCGQDLLDMVIPDNLSVRNTTELYGPDEPVEVIDVKSQEGEGKKWNMRKWADYYYESNSSKPIRNVISLEVSRSPLGRLIRRPKIVRDLDLQDSVWPRDLQAIGDFPRVQFYCLMSVADCYTDFHIDFGGSSVYYHILKGKKTFLFIPPKDKHLKKYEEWCNSSAQDATFLGDQTKECYRVDLSEGDTMLIPSGWIHAVWTPENSLVIGGNFLTRMNYGMQIKVAKIEKDTKVPMKFRYPFFQKIMWYTALKYLAEDPVPPNLLDSFARDESYRFYREHPIYYEFGEHTNRSEPGSEYYNARFYSQAELEGLPELGKYLFRTALIAGGYMVEGVAKEARNAVNRSIPKGQGDPLEVAQKFGVWVAWKRGNEPAAEWTRPEAISPDMRPDLSDKKPSRRSNRRSERSTRPARADQQNAVQRSEKRLPSSNGLSGGTGSAPSTSGTLLPVKRKAPVDTKNGGDEGRRIMSKSTGLGPKRVACEACRKRRIRCRHKDEHSRESMSDTLPTTKQSSAAADAASDVRPKNTAQIDSIASDYPGDSAVSPPEPTTDSACAARAFEPCHDWPAEANGPTLDAFHPAKKGRSKACDECRKSKRRCIHDEVGRIDPQKAQERSRPRVGTAPSRQALPSDEENEPQLRSSRDIEIEGEEAPGVRGSSRGYHSVYTQPTTKGSDIRTKPTRAQPKTCYNGRADIQELYASPPAQKLDAIPSALDDRATAAPVTTTSLVSPPTSLSDDMDGVSVPDGRSSTFRAPSPPPCLTAKTTTASSPRRPVGQLRNLRHPSPVTETETSGDNPTNMVSLGSATTPPAQSAASPIRDSSNSVEAAQWQENPILLDDKQGTEALGHRQHSNTSPISPSQLIKAGKRDRPSSSEVDADPESLKLIRELQEQEFSLRRRAGRP